MSHKNVQAAKLAVMQESTNGANLRELMVSAELVVQPHSAEILGVANYTLGQKAYRHVRVKCVFRLFHVPSETWEDLVSLGEAADTGDTAVIKACQVAYSFAMAQTFLLQPSAQQPPIAEPTSFELGGVQRSVTETGGEVEFVKGSEFEQAES
jgi:hypothetical protein